jgi:hypothetical protein
MYEPRHMRSSNGSLNALLVAEIGDLKGLSAAGLTTEAHLKHSTTRKNDGLALASCMEGAWVVVHSMHTCPDYERY